MATIHILYWGGEAGSREDCSIFYTQSKAYQTKRGATLGAIQCKVDNDALLADGDEDAIEAGDFYTHIAECELEL